MAMTRIRALLAGAAFVLVATALAEAPPDARIEALIRIALRRLAT